MNPNNPHKLRVFVDADVLFAGSASPTEHGASLTILRLAEITLIEAITSRQVIIKVERNLEQKLPSALPAFRLLVSRCLRVVNDPCQADLEQWKGMAHPKDLPILIAAVSEQCPYLVTFNLRDYQPGHPDVTILRPGALVQHAREMLAAL